MFFDPESIIIISKFNNLSQSLLIAYCQNFGKVIRCLTEISTQAENKDSYVLIQFTEASSVTSVLSHRNHIINGVHISMQNYHRDTYKSIPVQKPSSLKTLTQQNQITSNNNHEKTPEPMNYNKIMRENFALKHDIANLNQAFVGAQTYAKIAYDAYKVLQEKFEVEQALTKKLKLECTTITESYEARLKELSSSLVSSSRATTKQDKIKEEPIDFDSQRECIEKHLHEMKIIKDHLEQAQVDLGKCQTKIVLLNAKLIAREHQFDNRHKELNNRYRSMKKQYEHLLSCIQDFQAKLYPNMRLIPESKECNMNKWVQRNNNETNDSNEDIEEIVMEVEPTLS
ncbi:unnamed protein product [Rotaria sp. Silwood1]|nr:unnamed protein product [Rotaria sp. Silwood1]CAF1587380.1 unnamed protein product [Rotaria sp. Silwood1]CAF3702784.1 unnamed protein product [Rotaria sp. Silwood1]CAF4717397.1 unnamed protein product [Rotaria sp. Silwood1]